MSSGLLVVGLGNAWRGDDGAGPAVARGLGDDRRVLVHEGEPITLIEGWSGAGEVILVDAVSSGAPAGTVHRLDPLASPMPAELVRGSTHAVGLADTLELARTLDRLPPRLTVYGIEGERFAAGDELSPAVRDAVEVVRAEVSQRLAAALAEDFIAAFGAADFASMRSLLAGDLVAHVTNADGGMDRVEGRDPYLARIEAMDLPSARFTVELTQPPVVVETGRVLVMVEVRAQRGDRSLHNFAAHLLRVAGGRIVEWHMADAKPAESDRFWG